jgi:eukaryotic-like serine/threonine-protein kinase
MGGEELMTDDLIGKTIGGYEILDIVGKGGMATVYRAQQVSMNRVVAVKVLPEKYINDDTYIQRFNQEVAIVSKLEHRNIVPVHDYGEYNGQPYIVMRYMAGRSVDDLLSKGPLDIDTIVTIIEQIAPALDYAHSRHVLHRDLKPSNVLLDDNGGYFLTDFGIARVLGDQQVGKGITTQGVVGTPSYMSPEQAQGLPLDNRSDIYALGVMLFELSTGRRPFESDTPYGIAVMQVTTPPPSPRGFNPQLSFAVEEVIFKALKKKREERYPNAVAVAEALKRAVDKPVSSLHDTQPRLRARQPTPAAAQPQPQIIPPPPQQSYSPQQPVSVPVTPGGAASGYMNQYIPRRRKQRGSNVWVSAALGGILGCGLLAVLVVTILIIVNGVNQSQSAATPTAKATVDDSSGASREGVPTLDLTSQAGRSTLIPGGSASVLDEPTLGIAPVGVRPTATQDGDIKQVGGGMVFFANRDDNYDLYKMDLGSGHETQLTFDPGVDSYPAVSPDGKSIAFQSNRDGDFDIYVMGIDGSGLRQLTNNSILDRIPSWSPDGQWIIFSSDTRNNDTYDLYAIHPDGSDLHPIFTNGERNSYPRYDPNGQFVVFTTGNPNDGATWDIGQIDVTSGHFTRLTNNGFKDWSPSYKPDGSGIIFLTADGGNASGEAAIAVMDDDGSNRRILYDGAGYEWDPVYSPDSSLVAFSSLSSLTAQEEVFIIRADGTGLEQVTNQGGQGPSWIPSGS